MESRPRRRPCRRHSRSGSRSRSITSTSAAPGHRTPKAPVRATAGLARGQSRTYSRRCARWRRKPTAPRPSTATRTRLRYPSPSESPGTASTTTGRSTPASRSSCSAMRKDFRRRCASGVHVLEVAAAAAPGSGVGARSRDPVGGRGQDLDGVRPQIGGGGRRDAGPDPLARKAVADEDHLAVGRPADAAATGGDGTDLQLEQLVSGLFDPFVLFVGPAPGLRPLRHRAIGHGGHVGRA